MNAGDIFINCPFATDYRDLFRATVFAIIRSGFVPRCALETDDSSEVRLDKICKLINECRYGIHDISLTELDMSSELPRFNMPFELGLFIGAKKFGSRQSRTKKCLIFDRDPSRYQKFLSDIAGQDIQSHDGKIERLIERLANWLRAEAHDPKVPGGRLIANEFRSFSSLLPEICAIRKLHEDEITFLDYQTMATEWIASEHSS